jgi:hypothetical protein
MKPRFFMFLFFKEKQNSLYFFLPYQEQEKEREREKGVPGRERKPNAFLGDLDLKNPNLHLLSSPASQPVPNLPCSQVVALPTTHQSGLQFRMYHKDM